MKFILSNMPMPPSSNHQYWARAFIVEGRPMAKIAPSRELEHYVNAFGTWALTNNVAVAKAKKFVRDEIMMKGKMIGIDSYSCFPHTSLWTQKSTPKRMDASNRIKALHDCLADILQIDDSCFWQGQFAKIESKRPNPWVFVELYPVEPLSVTDWQEKREQENGKKEPQGNGHLG